MDGGEAKAVATISKAMEQMIPVLGDDLSRSGLIDTPARIANMYLEMTVGLRTEPPKMTFFDRGDNDQMITILDIDYYSICEHHFVPFYGRAHIGYIPKEKLSGLSKFGRIVEWFAKRPQIQEQLTAQIADYIFKNLEPQGVIVVLEGKHLCMAMRGVKKQNHKTITSAIRGDIAKDEFFSILKLNQGV